MRVLDSLTTLCCTPARLLVTSTVERLFSGKLNKFSSSTSSLNFPEATGSDNPLISWNLYMDAWLGGLQQKKADILNTPGSMGLIPPIFYDFLSPHMQKKLPGVVQTSFRCI